MKGKTQKATESYARGELTEADLHKYFSTVGEGVGLIELNMRKASDLIQSFKQVAVDQSDGEIRTFDLKNYIEEVVLSLKPLFKKTRVKTVIECEKHIRVTTYPGALSQILSNLMINSLTHAFNKGEEGTVIIKAEERADEEKVTLTVMDDGKGIDESIHKKVFDPFFTTKRGEGGSGLGLNILYNLVTITLKGTVSLQSEPGSGTIFTINIPSKLSKEN